MILCHPQIEAELDFSTPQIPSLVVENPAFFRALLLDLYAQQAGAAGQFILSDGGKELTHSTWLELVDNCLHFQLNSRPLLGRLVAAMERHAVSEEFFVKTAEMLQHLEQYVDELAFSFDCDIVCEHCTVAGILKAVGLSLRDDYDDPLERLLDYMEFIRTFDRDKLFVLVHLRSFFADEHLERFLQTVSAHGYHVLLMDAAAGKKLSLESRVTIDNDLCEF